MNKRNLSILFFALAFAFANTLLASSYVQSHAEHQLPGATIKVTFESYYDFYEDKSGKMVEINSKDTHVSLIADEEIQAGNACVILSGKRIPLQKTADKDGLYAKLDGIQKYFIVSYVLMGKDTKTQKAAPVAVERVLRVTNNWRDKETITDLSLQREQSKACAFFQNQDNENFELKVIVEDKNHKLDLGGKNLAEFTQHIAKLKKQEKKEGSARFRQPPMPKVFFELKNNSDQEIHLEQGGDMGGHSISGEGAGFTNLITANVFTMDMRRGSVFVLKPGEKHRWQLNMAHGARGSLHSFFTRPGECTLSFNETFLVVKADSRYDVVDRLTVQAKDIVINVTTN